MADPRPSDAPPPVVDYRGLRIRGPERIKAGQWRVTAVDLVLEEAAEKVFPTRAQAQRFIDELAHGAPPLVDPLKYEFTRQSNNPGEDFRAVVPPATPQLNGHHTRGRTKAGQKKDANAAPFNIRAVKDTLESYGLDPFAEIARTLTEEVMLRDRSGSLVIDKETGEPVRDFAIGGLDRAKILVELGQYVQPKLKAVEMKVEDLRKLSADQVEEEIQKLLNKPKPR